jgi:predicted DNA-binding protein (UPF0278 family)
MNPFLAVVDTNVVVAAGASHIVTFNQSDFRGAERFGLKVVEPREFLRIIREIV